MCAVHYYCYIGTIRGQEDTVEYLNCLPTPNNETLANQVDKKVIKVLRFSIHNI